MQPLSAMDLLKRLFDVELRFLQSDKPDLQALATAFHPEIVVHEPMSLPYAGDWDGLAGVGALFRKMRDVWSDLRVEQLDATRECDTVYMACTIHLTSRATGASITQPFAEVLRFKEDLLIEGTPFYYDTAEILAAIGGVKS
ncbi:MAG TPA: nuclear transport factor 2 family protein [Dongiaceae bacterium]|nr:nuclear transport factor 2 family protein [Dongiaceae bacterium]